MVEIRPFRPEDASAFRDLNEAWITKYFTLEPPDRIVLADPQAEIIARGGHILMVWQDETPIGCCALLPKAEPGEYELGKMAVAEHLRGQGIGRRLLEQTLNLARALARKIYLGSSTKLPNAVHLYESAGFRHYEPAEPHEYARANVHMVLELDQMRAQTSGALI